MVNNAQKSLDLVFQALSDPTRRKILRTLARGDFRVTDLAKPHDMSLPAVSRHLKILERAGLIRRLREGRVHYIQLRTQALKKASRWIDFYKQTWSPQLESLESLLKKHEGATRDRA